MEEVEWANVNHAAPLEAIGSGLEERRTSRHCRPTFSADLRPIWAGEEPEVDHT